MSVGVTKRTRCQFVVTTRHCQNRSLKDTGDNSMNASILSLWQPNMGYEMPYASHSRVFPGVNMKPTCRLKKVYRLGRVVRYRKKRTGTRDWYAATLQNDIWTIAMIDEPCIQSLGKTDL